jgi:uncharacterized protein DUF6395
MAQAGREVVVVPTDMEYLTSPLGVPTHLAFGVPALLLTGSLGLTAIAFGTIMESAYGIGYGRFRDFGQSVYWRQPEALYRTAGLRFAPVAAGLSEVATTRAVRELPYGNSGRSCVRGTIEPCWRCVKCFRKGLVAMTLDGRFDDALLRRALSSPEVKRDLLMEPIHHANVYAWAAARYTGCLREIKVLDLASGDRTEDLAWMERWYSPAVELLPAFQRESVAEAAARLVGTMSPREIGHAQSYGEGRSRRRAAQNSALVRAALLPDPARRFSFAVHEAADATWRRARRLGRRVVRRITRARVARDRL